MDAAAPEQRPRRSLAVEAVACAPAAADEIELDGRHSAGGARRSKSTDPGETLSPARPQNGGSGSGGGGGGGSRGAGVGLGAARRQRNELARAMSIPLCIWSHDQFFSSTFFEPRQFNAWYRRDGFQRPVHVYILAYWATFVVLAVGFFGCLVFFVWPPSLRFVALVATGALAGLHLASTLVTMSTDPQDRRVLRAGVTRNVDVSTAGYVAEPASSVVGSASSPVLLSSPGLSRGAGATSTVGTPGAVFTPLPSMLTALSLAGAKLARPRSFMSRAETLASDDAQSAYGLGLHHP
ncbi:hypothetical protein HK405_006554 [Cladochytrium tenue]|nr:hypothetical protein HK405_006554 [Cladochytrium tenue]